MVRIKNGLNQWNFELAPLVFECIFRPGEFRSADWSHVYVSSVVVVPSILHFFKPLHQCGARPQRWFSVCSCCHLIDLSWSSLPARLRGALYCTLHMQCDCIAGFAQNVRIIFVLHGERLNSSIHLTVMKDPSFSNINENQSACDPLSFWRSLTIQIMQATKWQTGMLSCRLIQSTSHPMWLPVHSSVPPLIFCTVFSGVLYGIRSRKIATAKDFLTAGGQMHFLPVALSMMASFLSAIFILGQCRFSLCSWCHG